MILENAPIATHYVMHFIFWNTEIQLEFACVEKNQGGRFRPSPFTNFQKIGTNLPTNAHRLKWHVHWYQIRNLQVPSFHLVYNMTIYPYRRLFYGQKTLRNHKSTPIATLRGQWGWILQNRWIPQKLLISVLSYSLGCRLSVSIWCAGYHKSI